MKKLLEECDGNDSELLTCFGIKEDWLHRYPRELSGSELQRFSYVLLVLTLIADEMTTMLDAIT